MPEDFFNEARKVLGEVNAATTYYDLGQFYGKLTFKNNFFF